MEETDRLFLCDFCKVKSYLLSSTYHYAIQPTKGEGRDGDLVYFPYWRFKGMLFTVLQNGIRDRLVDMSYRAMPLPFLPVSLGLRTQALKLRFTNPELPGRFFVPSLSRQEVLKTIESNFGVSSLGSIFHKEFIGETFSIIYAPFYIESKVIDAVLNRPVSDKLSENIDLSSYPSGGSDWKVRFIATLCPNCGWDLKGERDSIALYCENCESMWYAGSEGFVQIRYARIQEDVDNLVYLPFYRIQADVSGLVLSSYANLIKLSNQPKVIQPGWEKQPFHFWSPAFKIRPKDFLRLSSSLTIAQPQNYREASFPKEPVYPVTLPFSEAEESLKLNLANFVKPPRSYYPKLADIEIKAKDWLLVYLPFHLRGNELSQPAYRLRINKNLLDYARSW